MLSATNQISAMWLKRKQFVGNKNNVNDEKYLNLKVAFSKFKNLITVRMLVINLIRFSSDNSCIFA